MRASSIYREILTKAEGDHGGRVIGHTRSGRAVYQTLAAKHYKNFTAQEHFEASAMHNLKSRESFTEHRKTAGNALAAKEHLSDHSKSRDGFAHQSRAGGHLQHYAKMTGDKTKTSADLAVGVTRSGKPVKMGGDYSEAHRYDADDHADAADAHSRFAAVSDDDHSEKSHHEAKAKEHRSEK